MTALLIRGGTVVDPVDGVRRADVLVEGAAIRETGLGLRADAGTEVIDAGSRYVVPGFVDTHSHADARVLDDDVQLALLRQGVTSVVAGQDGVSFAPGDGRYASDYFGALNGYLPGYRGGGVADLLAAYDGRTRIGVGYLVPAGTVRQEVMGGDDGRPSAEQLDRMVTLVRAGLAAGALGLSSGMDYVPGCFADADELAVLCGPVAEAGALYVTHMRGYEEASPIGMAEVEQICAGSGVAAHVSHFHARSELVAELLGAAAGRGHDVTFDAYPYFRGSTILSMVLLPAELVRGGNRAAAELLRDEAARTDLREGWLRKKLAGQRPGWAGRIRVASAGCADWSWTEGLTLEQAGTSAGEEPAELAYHLLADSALTTTVVMEIPDPRTDDDLARQFALPGAMCGSDGIYHGSYPHPRGWGTFARMLARFVVERGDFDWPTAVMLLSGRPAIRFGLGRRGSVRAGAVADIAVVDPAAVASPAWYDTPRALAIGIEDVVVAGRPVLAAGMLTAELAGGGIRRGGPAT